MPVLVHKSRSRLGASARLWAVVLAANVVGCAELPAGDGLQPPAVEAAVVGADVQPLPVGRGVGVAAQHGQVHGAQPGVGAGQQVVDRGAVGEPVELGPAAL